MDLRNFIKETLVQIAQGIDDAKVYGYLSEDKKMRQVVQSISFDVTVLLLKEAKLKVVLA